MGQYQNFINPTPRSAILIWPFPTIRMGGRGAPNGAHYSNSLERPISGRRGGGRCCCCCLLFCHVVRVLIGVGVAAGVAALVIWAVVRPTKPRFHVESASVSNFNLTGVTLDAVRVRLSITSRNPSKKMGIYYRPLHASACYREQMIAWSSALPSFYQPHKNTTALQPILDGGSIQLPIDVSEELSSAYRSGGAIQMDVRIRSRIRFKVGPFKSKRYTLKVECNLLLDGLNKTTAFGEQKCKVDL